MDTDKLTHADLSEAIIGAGKKVLNTLKPGLNEEVCENALAIERRKRGHRVDQQRRFDVIHGGHVVDGLVPDRGVDDRGIAGPKVAGDFTLTHSAQITGCLGLASLRLALRLNLKHAELKWHRIVRWLNPCRSVKSVVS